MTPRYKLTFQDASWQDRKFISLTKIENNGTARVLNCAMGGQSDQMSFGIYAPRGERGIEYTHDQTYMTDDMMGSKIADEQLFTHLLQENILEKLFCDKAFLKKLEKMERNCNHPVLIQAALDLQKGICRETIGRIGHTSYPRDYRAYVIKHYINYLLNRDGMRINAHPEGLFTEIHVGNRGPFNLEHGGGNDLPVTKEAALQIQQRMKALIVEEFPPYPIIFQYRFLGQVVPDAGMGRYLEITDLMAEQIQVVDSLFDFAAEKGFFPDSKEMVRKAWVANCEKMSKSASSSYWAAGSPALLSVPVITSRQNDELSDNEDQVFDIRFKVGQQ